MNKIRNFYSIQFNSKQTNELNNNIIQEQILINQRLLLF
jgi:hypothetical protein